MLCVCVCVCVCVCWPTFAPVLRVRARTHVQIQESKLLAQEALDTAADKQKRGLIKHLAHVRSLLAPSGNLEDPAAGPTLETQKPWTGRAICDTALVRTSSFHTRTSSSLGTRRREDSPRLLGFLPSALHPLLSEVCVADVCAACCLPP